MISHSLETRFIPLILLLVLLKVVSQCHLILGSLVPDTLVADLVKQQTIMILLNQIAHLHIYNRHRVCALVQNLLLGQSAIRILDQLIQFTISDSLARTTLVNELQNALTMEVKRFQLLTLLHQDDMPAKRRQYRFAHLSGLQSKSGILELLDQLVLANPS